MKIGWKELLLPFLFLVCSVASRGHPLDVWNWRNPTPQGGLLYSLAYGNERFVAVGLEGRILSSPDAIHWQIQNSGTHQHLVGVTYGNGRFVAAGKGLGIGFILTSDDGADWTERTLSATALNFTGIAYGNGVFVAVGQGRAATSRGSDRSS